MPIKFTTRLSVAVLALILCGLMAPTAHAGISDTHLRTELSLGKGVHSGNFNRNDDFMATLSLEWAFAVAPRVELGLRGIAMYYDADMDDGLQDWGDAVDSLLDDFDLDSDYGDDTILGIGFGIAARFYTKKEAYNGVFFEVAGHALAHDGHIPGNSSNFNFYTTGGIGYQFKSNWHVIAKCGHISNAGLGSNNSGSNVASIGVGYSF